MLDRLNDRILSTQNVMLKWNDDDNDIEFFDRAS